MRYLVILLGCLVSFGVVGDARIRIDNAACHFPKDNNNTDDEDKIYCEGRLLLNANNTVVAGYALVEQEVPEDFVPPTITTRSNGDNGDCQLYDDDGNANAVATWEVNISGDCKGNNGNGKGNNGNGKGQGSKKQTCVAVHEIICGTGDDAYADPAEIVAE